MLTLPSPSIARVKGCNTRRRYWIGLCGVLILCASRLDASDGHPVLQRYPIGETGVIGQPRVIQQLADHQLAVGTERGLFLYDGRQWTDVRGQSGTHSLAALPDGRFFVGSGSEVFELRPDGHGAYVSASRTEGLLRGRPDSIVFGLAVVGETVYGLDGDRLVVIPPEDAPWLLELPTWCAGVFVVGEELYLRTAEPDHPLRRFDPVARVVVAADERIPVGLKEVFVAHSQDAAGTVWLATASGRFFGLGTAGSTVFPGTVGDQERPVRIQALQALPKGGLAVATVNQGVILLDDSGREVGRTRPATTGGPGRVYALGADADGGLWMGAALELSRIDGWLRSWVFGEAEGLLGEVWAIVRHRGQLYVGTDTGLFVQQAQDAAQPGAFARVDGVPPVKSLLSTADGLWIAETRLHLLLPDGRIRTFGDSISDANPLLQPQGRPDVMLIGVGNGLRVLRRVTRTWEDAGAVPEIERQVFDLAQTASGDIWASLGTGAVVRVRWRGESFEVQTMGAAEGIPNRWVHLGVLGDSVYLGADNRSLRWDEAAGRFVTSVDMIYYGSGEPFGFDPVFNNANGAWVWPQATRGDLVPRPEPDTLAAMAVTTGHLRARSRSVWYDPDGLTWIGLPTGLLRHRPEPAANAAPRPPLQLQRLVDLRTRRSLLGRFSGNGSLRLPHRHNSWRVEAALPRFQGERFAQYSIELRGYDLATPPFSSDATREFSHLAPGDYHLEIRAMDGAGRWVEPVTLQLHVKASLWANPWAYAVYTLLGAGVVFGLIRWRVARLRQQASELQAAVDQRTAEISQQAALLQKEKDLVASLAAAAPVGIWHGGVDGRIVMTNTALEALSGRTATQLIAEGWLPTVHRSDEEAAKELLREAGRGNPGSAELRFQRPNGEVRWVIAGVAPVRYGPDGGAGVVGTALDVTERREIERRAMRAQRLESVGTLTGGIAHDLNNALVPIIAGLPLLESPGDGERASILKDIDQSARRAAGMVRQLLAFARGAESERVLLDLRSLVQELAGIIERTFPKNVHQRYEYPPGPAWVMGDQTQLHQVLLNLCLNARDAMPDGGSLTVRLKTVRTQQELEAFQERIPPGRYQVIEVQDSGTGIAPDLVDKIFDPFFTTKEPDRGTGLGLSTSIGIIRGHRGYFGLQTVEGRGSMFVVYLPAVVAPATAPTPPVQTAADAAFPLPRLALVVDDEPAVRSVVTRTLERLKVRSVEAADGEEGLRTWQLHKADIGLAVIDLNMPIMPGTAMIRQLRQTAPELPIIAFSGNLSEEQRAELMAMQVACILPKPFRFEQLTDGVRQAMARSVIIAP